MPTVERKRGKVRDRSQRTKDLFEERISACAGLEEGSQEWWVVRQSYTKQITKACRSDWRQHVMGLISEMTMAAEKGDAKQVSRLVNKIAGSGKGFNSIQPMVGADGVIFGDAEELAEAWREFAESKFAATQREALRGALPEIGSRKVGDPSDEDLQLCLNAMSKSLD